MLVGLGLLGCTARRVVAPPPFPTPSAPGADFGAVTLVLRSLTVANASSADPPAAADQLRGPLLNTLRRTSRFRAVEDMRELTAAPDAPALLLDLELHASHSSSHTYILDFFFFYPWTGLFPVTPWWGDATVIARARALTAEGREVWSTSERAQRSYSMVEYSWYRTGPVEDAYRAAYGTAFERVAYSLAGARDEILAALGDGGGTVLAVAVPPPPDGPLEKLAVLPARLETHSEAAVPELFDDYVLSAVHQTGHFEVIGQSDLDALIDFDKQKELLGCDDVSCFAELGGALGVDLLLSISVARIGEDWAATAKLVNLREVRVEARANVLISGEVRQLMEAMPALFAELLNRRAADPDAT